MGSLPLTSPPPAVRPEGLLELGESPLGWYHPRAAGLGHTPPGSSLGTGTTGAAPLRDSATLRASLRPPISLVAVVTQPTLTVRSVLPAGRALWDGHGSIPRGYEGSVYDDESVAWLGAGTAPRCAYSPAGPPKPALSGLLPRLPTGSAYGLAHSAAVPTQNFAFPLILGWEVRTIGYPMSVAAAIVVTGRRAPAPVMMLRRLLL